MLQERRTEAREPLQLSVQLQGGGGGITRNVSLSGLLFDTDATLPLGSVVVLDLNFATAGGGMGFQTRGEVVRVEAGQATHGVAVRMLDARLLPRD